ncbi:hypothetical protein M0805_005005 [Coniferiporia weirii]|nr:hypothetical protein M0805_005005 [Coniferiporia weirii]
MAATAKEINLAKPNEFNGTREYASYNVDSKGNKLTTIVRYGTWSDFVKDFKTTFITTDDTNEAQQALIRLKQTGTADDFNNQFQSLATRSGITSPEALIALYQAGLTPALLKSIYNRDTMPTTINAWTIRTTEQTTETESPVQIPEDNPPTPNDIALQIRQLINSLKDEEKEELFNTMDKQDF